MPDLAGWDAREMESALDSVDVPLLAIQSTTLDTARQRVSLEPGLSSPWLDLVSAHVPSASIEMLHGYSHFPQIELADEVTALIADRAWPASHRSSVDAPDSRLCQHGRLRVGGRNGVNTASQLFDPSTRVGIDSPGGAGAIVLMRC